MLKKRYYMLFLAVLSFFVLVGCSNVAAANKFGKTKAAVIDNGPAVKMYMPMGQLEPDGGEYDKYNCYKGRRGRSTEAL